VPTLDLSSEAIDCLISAAGCLTIPPLTRHVLSLAIEDAVASEKAVLAAAKEKLQQIETAERAAGEAEGRQDPVEASGTGSEGFAGQDSKAEV